MVAVKDKHIGGDLILRMQATREIHKLDSNFNHPPSGVVGNMLALHTINPGSNPGQVQDT